MNKILEKRDVYKRQVLLAAYYIRSELAAKKARPKAQEAPDEGSGDGR